MAKKVAKAAPARKAKPRAKVAQALYYVEEREQTYMNSATREIIPKDETLFAVVRESDGAVLAQHADRKLAEHQVNALITRAER